MKLTAAARNALPPSDFAIPSQRKYPIEDAGHRRAALGRVGEFGTPAQKKEVHAKVGAFSSLGKK